MGIHGLFPYFHKQDSECAKDCKFEDFKGKKIAFDGNSLVYKYKYGNRPNTHILEIGRLYVDAKKAGIEAIFIFDGEHPAEKKYENELRTQKKRKFLDSISESQQQVKQLKQEYGFDPDLSIDQIPANIIPESKRLQYEQLQNLEDGLESHYASQIIVTPQDVEECKEILRCLGAWVIQAPGEGEAYASLMNRLGFVDYVATDDADVFPFGAKKLIRGIGWRSTRSDKMRVYDIKKILKDNELSQEELIDICVLCINDFNKECRVSGLGFDSSKKGIKTHGNIEKFFKAKLKDNEKKLKSKAKKPPKLFIVPPEFDYKGIRKIFSDYAFRKDIPEEFKQGNPFKFDMKKASFFFHSHNLIIQMDELKKWAKILQGKDYDDEDIRYLIDQAREDENESNDFDMTIRQIETKYHDLEEDEDPFCISKEIKRQFEGAESEGAQSDNEIL